MVATNMFGCRMSNTKISPQLAMLIGPIYAASAPYRGNFHTYDMKKYTDGRVGCHAFTELRLEKSNTARVKVTSVHASLSPGTQT
jgi:hypothetical protein